MTRPWFDSHNIIRRFEERRTAVLSALSSEPATAEQIARRIGSSKRTVYRELQALKDKGVPINAAPGRGYAIGGAQ